MSLPPLTGEQLAASLTELLSGEPVLDFEEVGEDGGPLLGYLMPEEVTRLVELLVPWAHREIVAEVEFLADGLARLEDLPEAQRDRRVHAQDNERTRIVAVLRAATGVHEEGAQHAVHGA